MVNLIESLAFTPAERMLLLTPMSFDIAALELFGPPGARLYGPATWCGAWPTAPWSSSAEWTTR